MKRHFAKSSLIHIESTDGIPPEKYIITYNIKGLYAEPDGTLKERNQHTLEINLTLGYPRRQPQCKLLTPIFHPNITETTVCAGDFYAASEGLDDLVIRIGRMIAFQEYNIKSPLNGIAARWTEKNDARLPVDSRELAPSESSSTSGEPASQPPPLQRPQRVALDPTALSSTPAVPPRGPDGSLKVTRADQATAIRQQIDEAWRSRDFDKVEHLLKAYGAISGEEPGDLRRLREALSVERYLAGSSRTCESASAKMQSKAFSIAVEELDAVPGVPEAPSPDYEARLREASKQVEDTKRTAVDRWVLSVRNHVSQLCQGDKGSYDRVDTALDELNRMPLSEEDRATIREQITAEARRTRTASVEKQIEQAAASSKWAAVIDLCAELAGVDPGSVSARTHHDDATRHLQEELAAEITSTWTKRDLDATQSLLHRYAEQWQELPEELQEVQRCLGAKRFLGIPAFWRIAALAALCATGFFVYHHLRQTHSFDSAPSEVAEKETLKATQQGKPFRGPTKRFSSARDARALLPVGVPAIVHTNRTHGFTIELPQGWSVSKSSFPHVILSAMSPDQKEILSISVSHLGGLSLADCEPRDFFKPRPERHLSASGSARIAGRNALWIEYSAHYSDGSCASRSREYYLTHHGFLLRIAGRTASAKTWSTTTLPELVSFTKSLRFATAPIAPRAR